MPDRLIKVDEVEPRLAITCDDPEFLSIDQQPKYAALTYCWGPPPHSYQQLKTTRSNMGYHMQAIPQDKLPQVVKDAIRVTRELGIRYLWKDALCILQDDGSDRDYQCTQMDNIYGNAYVTICSASSANCEEGFVFKKDKTPAIRMRPIHPDVNPTLFAINFLSFITMPQKTLIKRNGMQGDGPFRKGWGQVASSRSASRICISHAKMSDIP